MSRATDFLETMSLNAIFNKSAFTIPTNQYLALFLADPGETGAITSELSNASNYTRLTLNPLMSNALAGSPSAIPNSTDIVFPIASNNWGTITFVGVISTLTGAGTIYLYASLSSPVFIGSGEQFRINASNLVFTCD
jgi:hypothetical protein